MLRSSQPSLIKDTRRQSGTVLSLGPCGLFFSPCTPVLHPPFLPRSLPRSQAPCCRYDTQVLHSSLLSPWLSFFPHVSHPAFLSLDGWVVGWKQTLFLFAVNTPLPSSASGQSPPMGLCMSPLFKAQGKRNREGGRERVMEAGPVPTTRRTKTAKKES